MATKDGARRRRADEAVEKLLQQLPDGPMREALKDQKRAFVEENVRAYLEADAETRADMDAFFESEGPRKVREARTQIADGTPTSGEHLVVFIVAPRLARASVVIHDHLRNELSMSARGT